MIKLVPDPTFEHDVDIAIPVTGAVEKVKFTFRALTGRRVLSLAVVVGADTGAGRIRRFVEYIRLCWRAKKLASAVDLLDEMVVSWSGINVDYSKNNLRLLLTEYPGVGLSIFVAYFTGLREARTKN